jgi:hypothetical protein
MDPKRPSGWPEVHPLIHTYHRDGRKLSLVSKVSKSRGGWHGFDMTRFRDGTDRLPVQICDVTLLEEARQQVEAYWVDRQPGEPQ